MKREYSLNSVIKQIVEGRAARICAVAVSVFLCILTVSEFVALHMEWDIPALKLVSGEQGFLSGEYQQGELSLDESAENELLPEEYLEGGQAADNGGEPQGPGTGAGDGIEEPQEPGTEKTTESEMQEPGTEKTPESEEQVADTEHAQENRLPYYIRINRQQNCITIYTQSGDGTYGTPYKAMVCSTGLYNATPRGTFQLSTKYLWRELYGGVYGQYATRIHGGVLFHSVPYYRKAKSSLCTDKYNKLGQQASMGCVRLTVEDAKWIADNCPSGTTVEIYDDDDPGPLGKPEADRIDTDSPNKCWDPTDPDTDNPWNELSADE